MLLFELARQPGTEPDDQFFARKKRTSSGSPIAICAERRDEPETTMPGGGLLFIRNKIFANGGGADFYINRKGTKVEVVTEDDMGNEKVRIFDIEKFPFDRFEFTEEEREELEALNRAKNGANA